jgi:ClpP class serine protease
MTLSNDHANRRRALAWARSQNWAIERGALELLLQIAGREHLPDFSAVLARQGQPIANTDTAQLRDGVAVVGITGPIFRYANLFTDISGATSIETAALDLRTALDNPGVRAVVLNIDSPGGATAGISDFAQQIRAASKPVVAFVGGTGASAAYWIAAAAPWVVASDTAMVGSIGVIAVVQGQSDDESIEIVSSQSPEKRPDLSTDAGRMVVQRTVDSLAQVFVDAVAVYRRVSANTVLSDFGRGSVLVGRDALAAGMVDQIGTLEGVLSTFAGAGHGPAYAQLLARQSATPAPGPSASARPWDRITAAMNRKMGAKP